MQEVSNSKTHGAPYLDLSIRAWAFIFLCIVFVSRLSPEPILMAACIVTLPLGATILWRQGEPPILFIAFAMQWLQIAMGVFVAAFYDMPIRYLYGVPGIDSATWLSLLGVVLLAMCMRIPLLGVASGAAQRIAVEIDGYNVSRVAQAYFWAFAISWVLENIMWLVPGMGQVLFVLSDVHWIFFFALAVCALVKRDGYVFLWIAASLELAKGFTSFFSEYREVFLFLALAIVTARRRIDATILMKVSVVFAAVLVLSAWWSVVKTPYRDYLSLGTGRQVVLVDPMDRVLKLTSLMADAGLDRLPEGLVKLGDRIAYTEYFGRAIDWVPWVHPHTHGELWLEALRHISTPRLFFPDKPSLIPDIVKLERFTGLNLLDATGRDTEVPIGYMAECYVDFGPIAMFLPICLLGFLYGLGYRYYATRKQHLLFAYGTAATALTVASQYELTVIKIVGGGLTAYITMYLFYRFLIPPVNDWLGREEQ